MELTEKQQKRLKKIGKFLDSGLDVDDILELEDKIDSEVEQLNEKIETVKKMQGEPGQDGHTPTPDELVDVIESLIPEPVPGQDYILTESDKTEIASKIKVPIVKEIVKETKVVVEKPINIIREIAVGDEPNVVIEKINSSTEKIDGKRVDITLPNYDDDVATLQNRTQLLVQITDGLRTRITNIPQPDLSAYAPTSRTLTINGTALDLSADRSWTIATASGDNPTGTIGLTAVNGSASTFLRSDGAPALSQAIVPTWTGTHTFSNSTNSALFTGGAIGIGTSTPNASRQMITAPSYSLTSGTGTFTASVSSGYTVITGTGTSFLSEMKVGDVFGHTSSGNNGVITNISSNTTLYVEGTNLSGRSGNFGYVKRVNASEDASGRTFFAQSTPTIKTAGGTYNSAGTILNSGYFFLSNTGTPYLGLTVRDYAADGRMILSHNGSTGSYLLFTGSSANIIANALTIQNSLWATPLRLGSSAFSTGNNGIYITKTGDGASQTMQISTESYASNVVQPAIELYATTFSFGTRNTTWNDYVSGTKTFAMGSAGLWTFTAPTSSSNPLTIKGTGTYTGKLQEWQYDASNRFNVAVSSTGGVTFDAVGSGAGFTFSDPVTATQLTSSGLTAGRVTFAGTAGILTDDADFTFATDTLTVTKIVGSTSIKSALLESTGTVRLKGYTVATLPAGTVGDTTYVTDALLPAFLAPIAGGGAVVTPVFYDGTNWVAV